MRSTNQRDRGRGRGRGHGGYGGDQNLNACFCCGSTGHHMHDSSMKDGSCDSCGEIGHSAKMCRGPRTGRRGNGGCTRGGVRGARSANLVGDNFDLYDHLLPPAYSLTAKSPRIYISFKINNREVSFFWDSSS